MEPEGRTLVDLNPSERADVPTVAGAADARPPQTLGELIRREIPRWAEVVKAGHVKPE